MGILSGLLFATTIDATKKTSKVMDKTEYPHYLSYNCELDDFSKFHHKMIDEGYFRVATNKEKLSMLTIPELKNIPQQNLTKYLPNNMYYSFD